MSRLTRETVQAFIAQCILDELKPYATGEVS